REVVLVELAIGAGVKKRLGIGRPADLPLFAVAVRKPFQTLAVLVAHPDFLATGLIADEGDPFAVRRPARLRLAHAGRQGHALDIAAVLGDGKQSAMHRTDRPLAR